MTAIHIHSASSMPCSEEPGYETQATTRLSDDQARAAASLFKALADPARLQILDVLSQHAGAVCVCDLEGVVGLPDAEGQRPRQPTISHHLKVLRDAGLVGYEKRGLWAYYFVQRERLAQTRTLLDDFEPFNGGHRL